MTIKIEHVRVRNHQTGAIGSKGGITLAFEVVTDDAGQSILKAGIAICSDKENYNRATGRALAMKRLADAQGRFFLAKSNIEVASMAANQVRGFLTNKMFAGNQVPQKVAAEFDALVQRNQANLSNGLIVDYLIKHAVAVKNAK